MQFKHVNIIFMVCLALSVFSSYARQNRMPSAHSDGEAYLGGSIGTGKIDSDYGLLANSSSFLSQALGAFSTANSSKGGLSGRAYIGYLYKLTERVGLGPEFGWSGYKPTQNVESITVVDDDDGFAGNVNTTVSGWGFDFLANFTYTVGKSLLFFGKPGFQLAYQNTTSTSTIPIDDADDGLLSAALGDIGVGSNRNYTVAPEIIVGALWNYHSAGLGVAYQYVFGRNIAGLNRISNPSDRQMLTFDLKLQLW